MGDRGRTTDTLAALLGLVLCGLPVPAPAVAASAPGADATHAPVGVLPFIEDDYTRAVAEAKSRHVPLFIESWAPW
jgi:hypothetical protein